MRKAVFFDLDGTIIDVTHKRLLPAEAVRTAIRRLQEAGHYAFVATGRPYSFIEQGLLDLGFDGFVLMNGAVVMVGGEIIFQKPLPPSLVCRIVRLAQEKGLDFCQESVDFTYMGAECKGLEAFFKSFDVPLDFFRRDFSWRDVVTYKMEFYAAERTSFADFLQLPGVTGLVDAAHGRNFELYSAHESKGTGILHALEYIGVPVEESYAFGDGENDIEMMQTVAHALVMGNANERLLPHAETVVPTVLEDGAAWGIEHCILQDD